MGLHHFGVGDDDAHDLEALFLNFLKWFNLPTFRAQGSNGAGACLCSRSE